MRRKLGICLGLAAITVAAYWPLRHADFVYWDDPQYVFENPQITAGLTRQSVRWAFTHIVVANWHPLTMLSHMLDCQLFGVNAGPQHLVNLAFHTANVVLLFLVLTRMTGLTWRSAAVAAFFGLHPLRVESVAWLSERKDVLSGFFFMLTLLAYAAYVRAVQSSKFKVQTQEGTVPSAQSVVHSPFTIHYSLWYVLSLLFFALGLMSKPMLVTVPFVLLLLDFWPLRRLELSTTSNELQTPSAASMWRLILEKVPFFLVSAVSSLVTLEVQKTGAAVANIPFEDRFANAVLSYGRYLFKMLYPANLSPIYPHPAGYQKAFESWPQWEVWLSGLLVIGVSILCVRLAARKPYLPSGWFWFLGTMVPVIGLVQVGEQSIADRYTYIPLIGPTFALVWLVSDLVSQAGFRKYALPLLSFALLLVCGFLTFRQCEYWHNTTTLFQHAIEATPNNASAEFSLGVGLEHDGRLDLAIEHYRAALALNPQDQQAHYNLGQLLRKQGNLAEAGEQYSAVLQSNPNDYPALVNLAGVFARQGQAKEAVARFEDALRLQPDSIEVLNNLAWLLATSSDESSRDGARAVQLAEHVCELTHYNQTAMVGTLAAAYAAKGRFQDAVATARKACTLAEKSKEPGLLEKNQELLNLYESGKPYIETPGK